MQTPSSSSPIYFKVVVLTVAIPFLIGWILSPTVISQQSNAQRFDQENGADSTIHTPVIQNLDGEELILVTDQDCKDEFLKVFPPSTVDGVHISLHRNGEADACSNPLVNYVHLLEVLQSFEYCPDDFDKYDFESFLTSALARVLQKGDCAASDLKKPLHEGFLGFCDRGVDRTPILHDHTKLVRVYSTKTLPCHFHTREGLRLQSLKHLEELLTSIKLAATCDESETCTAPQLHLYAVPAGRVFMFAPKFIGETFDLSHVTGATGKMVSLQVMSLSPRVFDVVNFFSRDESASVVTKALAEVSESHRIKRSTTGASGHHLNSRRTSESGFDTHGATAVKVKKRCFDVLGFDEVIEGHDDGLQVLRYNSTTAYIPHLDYIEDPNRQLRHNYDSAGKGGNRFATILLYMTDLGPHDGGETVFTNAWPLDVAEKDRVDEKVALQILRESGEASALQQGSWEESMVAVCRTRLAVRPNSARAVLFYSQHPNGEPDMSSLHGGCPVLQGEKWAANLWMWNTIRDGYLGAPVNEHIVAKEGR